MSNNLFQSVLFPAEDGHEPLLKSLKPSDALKSSKASLRWSYSFGAPSLARHAFWFSTDDCVRMPAVGSTVYICLTKTRNLGHWQRLQVVSKWEAELARPFSFIRSTRAIASAWKSLQGTLKESTAICWSKLTWISSKRATLGCSPELLCPVYRVEVVPKVSAPRNGPRAPRKSTPRGGAAKPAKRASKAGKADAAADGERQRANTSVAEGSSIFPELPETSDLPGIPRDSREFLVRSQIILLSKSKRGSEGGGTGSREVGEPGNHGTKEPSGR